MGEVSMKALEMIHERDPKQAILDDLQGYLEDCEITGSDYLWVAYEREGKTTTGLLLPSSVRREDAIQGIVGLLVKVGPNVEAEKDRFRDGIVPALLSWAVIDNRYGLQFKLGKRHCRTVQAAYIHLLVQRPDIVM